MSRLLEFEMSPGKLTGELFKAILEETLVWGDVPEDLKARRKARREAILRDSAVPWILSDLVAILQFYDDVQDIVAFSMWNKKLFSPKGLAECMKRQALQGRRGYAALAACMCPLPRRHRKRMAKKLSVGQMALMGPLAYFLFRMFPGIAPIMYLLLAGQVSATLFGYGIALGPLLGASMELFFRGAAEVGLPFGPEHNKYWQLKRARALREAERGFGAARYLDWEDRLLAMLGIKFVLRDTEKLPEFVIPPGAYPDLGDVIRGDFGAIPTLVGLFAAMAPNVAAYMYNDFLPPMIEDLGHLASGNYTAWREDMNEDIKAALRILERGECLENGTCTERAMDEIALEQWGMDGIIDAVTPEEWAKLKAKWRRGGGLRPEEGGWAYGWETP